MDFGRAVIAALPALTQPGASLSVPRLRSRPQFQAVLGGVTVARTAHFAMHSCALDVTAPLSAASALPMLAPLFKAKQPCLGAMVPKRWAKRAVTRNLIKRQIYGVGTRYASQLPFAAHLVRLRAGFDGVQFISASSQRLKAAVRAELELLFSKALAARGSAA